jgi:transcriptional adapter 3
MLPVRTPAQPPPVAGPSKTTDVTEDFSKLKPPTQIYSTTFYSYIEPWLRPIKEEDIGLLEYVPDDTEAYVVPPLGRHYSNVWADEDHLLYGGPLPGTAAVNPVARQPTSTTYNSTRPKWEPATLADDDLLGEERGHGPLTERLVSALLATPDQVVWKGVKATEEAMEGRSAGGSNAAAVRDSMTVGDLEDRVRNSMRLLGLLGDDVRRLRVRIQQRF